MNLVDKFSRIVSAIEKERGPFLLFGLFVRADTPSVVDVIASAKWLDRGSRMSGMKYIVRKIGDVLKPKEVLMLSRIVPMETSDSEIRGLASRVGPTTEMRSLENFVFAGATILEAHILSAHRPAKANRSVRRIPKQKESNAILLATS